MTWKQIKFAIILAVGMIGWDIVKLNFIFKHLKYAWPTQLFNRDLDHGCRFNKVKWWPYIKTCYFIDAITCAVLHKLSFLFLFISSSPIKNVKCMDFLNSTYIWKNKEVFFAAILNANIKSDKEMTFWFKKNKSFSDKMVTLFLILLL